MTKQDYKKPSIDIVRYAEEDVLTFSPPGGTGGKDLPEQDP